jgi:putative membrane protein
MNGFLIRWAASAIALWVANALVPGVHIVGAGTILLAALLLGFVNAVVRPLVILLTLPATVLSLGLFLFVINAGMLALVAAMLDQMTIAGFGSALLGALVVGFVSWLVNVNVGNTGRIEVLVVNEQGRRLP